MALHRSPAFTAIYNEIKNSDRNRVLELGPMSGGCFQLFSKLSCKIQVENFAESLREHLLSKSDISEFDVLSNLASYKEDDKFDVILVWDLLNYLNLGQVTQFFDYLRPFCKPNTLVYMLRYADKNIPHVPRKFSVKDKYLLELSDDDVRPRLMPHYSTMQLLRSMPGYYLQDTLLGQAGMLKGITEHVLRFLPSAESKHLISKSETTRTDLIKPPAVYGTKKHLSPSIAEVMSLLQSDDDFVVLDLGAPANRPEDDIVKRSGSYFRVDLFSMLELCRSQKTETLNLSVLDYQMTKKFDVILVWDLFNYCTPAQIQQLDRALSSISHSDTFLLSYMYTGRNHPSTPSRFEVVDGSRVSISTTSASFSSLKSVTGVSLLRLLESFGMDKTYAYRDGMDRNIIEYIFAFNERAAMMPLKKSG